jgi:hypothetical protein
MRVMSFRVIVWFVSCFSAQSERLFQEWMTGRETSRLQIYYEKFSEQEKDAIIL